MDDGWGGEGVLTGQQKRTLALIHTHLGLLQLCTPPRGGVDDVLIKRLIIGPSTGRKLPSLHPEPQAFLPFPLEGSPHL